MRVPYVSTVRGGSETSAVVAWGVRETTEMRATPNGSTRRACAIVGVAVLMAGNIQVRAANWPQFRGRQASGVGDGKPPTTWDVETGRNVKWKARIPGLGHASPIVWGDRVFLTTAVSSAKGELELTTG